MVIYFGNLTITWRKSSCALQFVDEPLPLPLPPRLGRRNVDDEREDDSRNGDEGPLSAVPMLHGDIPEQGRGQENEAQNRPENAVKNSLEPMAEKPKQNHHHPGKKESQKCQKTSASHFALPPYCPFYQNTPTAVPR